MLVNLRNVWNDLSSAPFSLQDIPGFPFERYTDQLAVYNECERWYNGSALDDQPEVSKGVDLYPVKINPLRSIVGKHAYILFGETEDDGRLPVHTRLIAETDAEKEMAKTAEGALNRVWYENNGKTLFMENAVNSQVYGGCIFHAAYVPWEWSKYGGIREIPIKIEKIHPKGFVGTLDAGDPYRLWDAWFIRQIPEGEARRLGYTKNDQTFYLVQHETKNTLEAWVNDQPAMLEGRPVSGENPYGIVPAVYIPHMRNIGFLGTNAIDHLKGLVKEINLRFADYGDAVNDDAHNYTAMRNVQGTVQVKQIAEGLRAVDLGSAPNITGSERDPDLFEVRSQRASPAMNNLLEQLVLQLRRDSDVPAVAYGEDEGSQRSALTLATRFWPLTSHVGTERLFWTAGLNVMQYSLLRIMSISQLGDITEEHTKLRMKHRWAPMLPRDREADVQEWVQRYSADLGSIDTLLELTGDIEDKEEEKKLILEWLEKKAKIEAMAQPAPFGGGGSSSPQGGGAKTTAQKVGGGGGK